MPEPELTPASSPESPLRTIFVGREGVRAGWRLLIFFVLVAAMGAGANLLLRGRIPSLGANFSATIVILGELVSFVVILVATLIMGRFERRSLSDYGLPPGKFLGKHFWSGALWGFIMLSFIVGMMAIAHSYSAGGLALSASGIVKYGFLWAVAFLLVGFFEEFSFRGYMLFTLSTGMSFWPAAILTCALFAWAHHGNPGETWIGVAEIVLIALFLCVALRRTGSLWFAIGWHMSFDWGESFFYSTANSGMQATGHMLKASMSGSKWLSGGTVGPEATIFDLIVTAIGILLLLKIYPEAKYPALKPVPVPVTPEALSSEPPTESETSRTAI